MQAVRRRRPISVWVPDYFCNQPLGLVRQQGHSLIFYRVTDQLEPDWDDCRRLSTQSPPDVFVLVHYFGIATPAEEARRFANEQGAILVEDAAHILRPTSGVGEVGDFVLYSPHKWLATPRGAVLVIRSADAAHRALLRQGVGQDHGHGMMDLAWIARRLLQQTAIGQLFRWARPSGPQQFLDDPPEQEITASAHMSRLAHNLVLGAPFAEVAAAYRQHLRMLSAVLPLDAPVTVMPTLLTSDAPYRLVLRADTLSTAARLYEALRRSRLPVESWPDLPPEVCHAENRHAAAVSLRRTVLLVPIHQTANIDAMAAMLHRGVQGL